MVLFVTPVESTTLAAVAFDHASQCLWLTFRSGAIYCYFGVPSPVHQDLLAAPSKGAYFNRYIRGRYAFQRLALTAHDDAAPAPPQTATDPPSPLAERSDLLPHP